MDSKIVRVKEQFNVHPGDLWGAITHPEKMRQWFFHQIKDFKPEKAFQTSFDLEFDGKKFTHLWKIIEVVQGEKIVYDWSYVGYPGKAKVSFKLYASQDGSSLVVDHQILEPFPENEPAFSLESTKAGWKYLISKNLKEYLDNA